MTESKFTITIKELPELQLERQKSSNPLEKASLPSCGSIYEKYNLINQKVFIRTVTLYYVGILLEVSEKELVLTNASWIADTGNFSQAIVGGREFDEIEPFIKDDLIFVGRGGIIDCSIYRHELPCR